MKGILPVFLIRVSIIHRSFDLSKGVLDIEKRILASKSFKTMKDEKTMSYNHAYGGCIPFPEKEWRNWYDAWIVNGQGKRVYRYLQNDEGAFVGEIAYHIDAAGRCQADVLIHFSFRGKGYGRKGLQMLCHMAKENGIAELYDEIAIDNPSLSLFLKQGFKEVFRDEEKVIVKKVL